MFPFRRAERHRPASVRNDREVARINAEVVARKSFTDAGVIRHVR